MSEVDSPVFSDLGALLGKVRPGRVLPVLQRVCVAAYFAHIEHCDTIPKEIYIVPTYDDTTLVTLRNLGTKHPEILSTLDVLLAGMVQCRMGRYLQSPVIDTYLAWRVATLPKSDIDLLLLSFDDEDASYTPRRELLMIAWDHVTAGAWSVEEFMKTALLMISHYFRFPVELLIDNTFMRIMSPDNFMRILREFRPMLDATQLATQERLAALAIGYWRFKANRMVEEGFAVGEITLQLLMRNAACSMAELRRALKVVIKRIQKTATVGADLAEETWLAIFQRGDYRIAEDLLSSGYIPDPAMQRSVIKKMRQEGRGVNPRLLQIFNSRR